MSVKRAARTAKRTARKRAAMAKRQQRQQDWTASEAARFAAALRAGGSR